MERLENPMVMDWWPRIDEYEKDAMDEGDLIDMAYEHWRDEIR